jgi:hypothetical protein
MVDGSERPAGRQLMPSKGFYRSCSIKSINYAAADWQKPKNKEES